MKIDARLREINTEIAEAQIEVGILEEQIEFQRDVTEDARIRSLVSETPLADRDASEAAGDLARLQRSRDEAAGRIEALRAEQDRLLERMLEQR